MSFLLTDLGEEWLVKNGADGVTLTVGLYNDATDAIGDTDDLSAIGTEPGGAAYARQSITVSVADLSGDWGFDNDTQVSFDTSDSSQTVDGYLLIANFQASDTGDSAAQDHLIATGALSQQRNLSDIDTFDLEAGATGVTVS